MSLIGAMIAQAISGNPATVNYNMFVAAFGMLSLFYLIPAAWSDSFQGHALLPIVLDGLNMLFFFAGGTALAAGLGAHSCTNSVSQPPILMYCKANLSSELHGYQPHYRRRRQHQGTLSGGSSRHRLPLFRMGVFHCLIRLQHHGRSRQRCQHAGSWNPQG